MAIPYPWLIPSYVETGGVSIYKDMTYSSTAEATTLQSLAYVQGSGIPFRLTPDISGPITISNWEFRVGVNGSPNYDSFTSANGKLTDGGLGVMYANPTSAQTELWSDYALRAELWKTNDDDSKTVYGMAAITMNPSLDI